MIAEHWKNQEVADFNGIVSDNAGCYRYDNGRFVPVDSVPQVDSYQDVGILSSFIVPHTDFCIHCGEATGNGAIGVVVLEDKATGTVVWTMLSDNSNPFLSVEYADGKAKVKSTSGSIFSFRLPLNDPQLRIP